MQTVLQSRGTSNAADQFTGIVGQRACHKPDIARHYSGRWEEQSRRVWKHKEVPFVKQKLDSYIHLPGSSTKLSRPHF